MIRSFVRAIFRREITTFLTKKIKLLVKDKISRVNGKSFPAKNFISRRHVTILLADKMKTLTRKMRSSLRKMLTLRHEIKFPTRKTIKTLGKMPIKRHKMNIPTRKLSKLQRKVKKTRRKMNFLRVFFIFLRRNFIFRSRNLEGSSAVSYKLIALATSPTNERNEKALSVMGKASWPDAL